MVGIFIQRYPQVLGEDVAGEIVEVGEGVSQFKEGDRVIAYACYAPVVIEIALLIKNTRHCIPVVTNQSENGGFQLYTVAFASLVSKLPNSIPFEQGAVLPLAISTAAAGLYMKDFLHLPYPTKDAKPSGKSILIYGASSSVGAVTVQLAVASGMKVITTASPQHHQLARALGAAKVFDHKDPDVVDKLVEAIKSFGEFVGVYDAIGIPQTRKVCTAVLERFGGGFIASTLSPEEGEQLPDNVKAVMCKLR
jgi:NADPH:quinone reductase-like Zn-dependent oxidoreductase